MKILSFGEILWDIIDGKAHIGGAPFNLSAHLSRMGADSYVVSSLGDDDFGNKAFKEVEKLGIKKDFISTDKDLPTGTVDVKLNCDGVLDFTINKGVAWDNITLDCQQLEQIANLGFDIFCFGSLAQRAAASRESLNMILERIKFKEVFCDINLRQHYYDKEIIEESFRKSSIVKLNDKEALYLSEYLFNKKDTLAGFSEKIIRLYNIKIVCITKGAEGAEVFTDDKKTSVQGVKVDVADSVGAGDSFSAGFLASYFSGASPEESAELAVKVGGHVASHFGAIEDYSEELQNELSEYVFIK